MHPRNNSGHMAVFCLIRGTVPSGIQETGQAGNRIVSLSASIFYGPGLNFDISEMIHIIIHQ